MNAQDSSPLAVVTGGASGIGLALVKNLLTQGFRIAVMDLNEDALQAVATDHAGVSTFKCDTSDQQQVESVIAEIDSTLGPMARFIHCAAIMPGGDLTEMDTALINKIMVINYTGTVNVTKAVLSHMTPRNTGELVVIGSMAGSVLTHGLGAYCASKAATNTYMEVLIEENTSGVHIMLVNPPMVNTPLIKQALDEGPESLKDSVAAGNSNMVSPTMIVDAINTGLEKRKVVVHPGSAALMVRIRRFFPGLLWWLMRKANKKS